MHRLYLNEAGTISVAAALATLDVRAGSEVQTYLSSYAHTPYASQFATAILLMAALTLTTALRIWKKGQHNKLRQALFIIGSINIAAIAAFPTNIRSHAPDYTENYAAVIHDGAVCTAFVCTALITLTFLTSSKTERNAKIIHALTFLAIIGGAIAYQISKVQHIQPDIWLTERILVFTALAWLGLTNLTISQTPKLVEFKLKQPSYEETA